MQLSYNSIRDILDHYSDEWDSASEYGEPGYNTFHDTSMADGTHTPLVVLGNYWCRCSKFGVEDDGRNKLHSYEDHHPRLWKQMEQQGVGFEWYDEWTIDSDHNKAYRKQGDSYMWQPAYVVNGDSMLTADDDIAEWIVWATMPTESGQPRAIPTRIIKRQQIMEAGFFLIHDKMESGHHGDMGDDPKAMLAMEQDNMEKSGLTCRYLFTLDETSQFYIVFSMWAQRVKKAGEYGWDTETYDFRQLASEWHGGQASALYAFSSSGHIDIGLGNEIEVCMAEAQAGDEDMQADIPALEAMLEWVTPQINQEGE